MVHATYGLPIWGATVLMYNTCYQQLSNTMSARHSSFRKGRKVPSLKWKFLFRNGFSRSLRVEAVLVEQFPENGPRKSCASRSWTPASKMTKKSNSKIVAYIEFATPKAGVIKYNCQNDVAVEAVTMPKKLWKIK